MTLYQAYEAKQPEWFSSLPAVKQCCVIIVTRDASALIHDLLQHPNIEVLKGPNKIMKNSRP